ncbi:mucin-2-like [Physella acuta]|uniref:mucin-2-like n=1 Tax=Physella acuta TaxID=109671 RepID=UPI0027DE8669|nr:mucin-2-like [Physella acuta]
MVRFLIVYSFIFYLMILTTVAIPYDMLANLMEILNSSRNDRSPSVNGQDAQISQYSDTPRQSRLTGEIFHPGETMRSPSYQPGETVRSPLYPPGSSITTSVHVTKTVNNQLHRPIYGGYQVPEVGWEQTGSLWETPSVREWSNPHAGFIREWVHPLRSTAARVRQSINSLDDLYSRQLLIHPAYRRSDDSFSEYIRQATYDWLRTLKNVHFRTPVTTDIPHTTTSLTRMSTTLRQTTTIMIDRNTTTTASVNTTVADDTASETGPETTTAAINMSSSNNTEENTTSYINSTHNTTLPQNTAQTTVPTTPTSTRSSNTTRPTLTSTTPNSTTKLTTKATTPKSTTTLTTSISTTKPSITSTTTRPTTASSTATTTSSSSTIPTTTSAASTSTTTSTTTTTSTISTRTTRRTTRRTTTPALRTTQVIIDPFIDQGVEGSFLPDQPNLGTRWGQHIEHTADNII